jgi:hypothetical protein
LTLPDPRRLGGSAVRRWVQAASIHAACLTGTPIANPAIVTQGVSLATKSRSPELPSLVFQEGMAGNAERLFGKRGGRGSYRAYFHSRQAVNHPRHASCNWRGWGSNRRQTLPGCFHKHLSLNHLLPRSLLFPTLASLRPRQTWKALSSGMIERKRIIILASWITLPAFLGSFLLSNQGNQPDDIRKKE